MKTIKVGINGFGRIGRAFLKEAWNRPEIEIVAVNDLGSLESIAYLLKYDTVYRVWNHDIKVDGTNLVIDGKAIKFVAEWRFVAPNFRCVPLSKDLKYSTDEEIKEILRA